MKRLQISFLKLIDHRNGKRLWLQGLRLAEAGFVIGHCYQVTYSPGEMVMRVSPDGNKVSRKKVGMNYFPVIDVVNQKLAKAFGDIDQVRVSLYENGTIRVELTHVDRRRIEREQKLAEYVATGKALPIASMAHGAGILDYYLHRGLSDENVTSGLIWAVEPENTYLQTSWNNNPTWAYESEVIEGRIEDIEAGDLKAPMILVAGLPCTGASLSGRAKNKLKFAEQHESAGTAFIGYLMAIRELSPAICILENVPQYSTTVSMHMIRETLTEWKYQIHETILDRELGAFEDRKRLCMVAVSKGLDFKFDLEPVRQREHSLGEILEQIPADSNQWNACSYLDAKQARDKASGKGFMMQLVDETSTRIGTIGRSYNKVAINRTPGSESP